MPAKDEHGAAAGAPAAADVAARLRDEAEVDRDRLEFRLSGSGGQGLVLAATVLAEAATAAGFEVVQTQSYGPEARGGASRAEVVVARAEIDFPAVLRPDLTLCLSTPAFDKYAGRTRHGGLVLYDSGLVSRAGTREAPAPTSAEGRLSFVGRPFTALAREHAGTPLAANIAALGGVERLVGLLGYEALAAAVRARLPQKLQAANLAALKAGFDAVA